MIQFKFERLLHSRTGKILISIVLGLGIASLFHKLCKDKDCIIFNGPVISEIDGKVFEHDNKCFQYETHATVCDETKKILNFSPSRDPFTTKTTQDPYGIMGAF